MITLDSLDPPDLRRAAAEVEELALLAGDRGAGTLAAAYAHLAAELSALARRHSRPTPPPDIFL